MLCNLTSLVESCLSVRPTGPTRVALLIAGFPRKHHPINEFAKLLYLLREHSAKATFVVDWTEIRERGMCASVGEIMQLLKCDGHELAIQFKTDVCGVAQLRQHAAEALHFMQRVYGITVVSVKVGCRLPISHTDLQSLGVAIVDGLGAQISITDNQDILNDLELLLHDLRERQCVRVSDLKIV